MFESCVSLLARFHYHVKSTNKDDTGVWLVLQDRQGDPRGIGWLANWTEDMALEAVKEFLRGEGFDIS